MLIESSIPVHSTESPLTISFRRAEMRALWIVGDGYARLDSLFRSAALGERRPLGLGSRGLCAATARPDLVTLVRAGRQRLEQRRMVSARSLLRAYTLTSVLLRLVRGGGPGGIIARSGACANAETSRWILARQTRNAISRNVTPLEGARWMGSGTT